MVGQYIIRVHDARARLLLTELPIHNLQRIFPLDSLSHRMQKVIPCIVELPHQPVHPPEILLRQVAVRYRETAVLIAVQHVMPHLPPLDGRIVIVLQLHQVVLYRLLRPDRIHPSLLKIAVDEIHHLLHRGPIRLPQAAVNQHQSQTIVLVMHNLLHSLVYNTFSCKNTTKPLSPQAFPTKFHPP